MSMLDEIVHVFSRKYFTKKLENLGKLRSFQSKVVKFLKSYLFGRSHYI
jgi:hypothetical protein